MRNPETLEIPEGDNGLPSLAIRQLTKHDAVMVCDTISHLQSVKALVESLYELQQQRDTMNPVTWNVTMDIAISQLNNKVKEPFIKRLNQYL